MIFPLGRVHRGGTLSITSSRAAAVGAAVGRTAGALGPAPTAAVEGLAAEEGSAAAMSAAGDPAVAEEGPAAEGDGP